MTHATIAQLREGTSSLGPVTDPDDFVARLRESTGCELTLVTLEDDISRMPGAYVYCWSRDGRVGAYVGKGAGRTGLRGRLTPYRAWIRAARNTQSGLVWVKVIRTLAENDFTLYVTECATPSEAEFTEALLQRVADLLGVVRPKGWT
jgi:hypothetical protein